MTVDLWVVDLDAVVRCGTHGCLSDDERARAARMNNSRVRAEFVASREALRHILGLACDASPHDVALASTGGKPVLAGEASVLRFNLSHCGGRALVATTIERDIGADLERIRPVSVERIARGVLTPDEIGEVAGVPARSRRRALFERWVRKEAVAKASGEGLSILRAVRVRHLADGQYVAALPERPRHVWRVTDVTAGRGWVAAVAVSGVEPIVVRRHAYVPAPRRVARSA